MQSIVVVSPVHRRDDIRIYKKEIRSLRKSFSAKIHFFARDVPGTHPKDICFHPVPALSRFARFLYIPILTFRVLFTGADVYHIHNPDTLPLGFLLKMLGRKVIYDTHEDFSLRLMMRHWIPPFLRIPLSRFISGAESLAGHLLDGVIVTQKEILQRTGPRSIVLENAPLLDSESEGRVNQISRNIEESHPGVFRIVYVGGISNARGLQQMLDAMYLLNQKRPARLWLIGPFFSSEEENHASTLPGWEYTDYLGLLPQEEAFAYMKRSSVGLVVIQDVADHKQTSANKIYEYQMMGIPFVASNFPRWREQLEEVGSGFFVNQESTEEIAAAMVKIAQNPEMASDMSEKGKHYIRDSFHWELEEAKLINLYRTLLKEN